MQLMTVHKNDYLTYFAVFSDDGKTKSSGTFRAKDQLWVSNGLTMHIQGSMPSGLKHWGAGTYNCFGKKHLLSTGGGKSDAKTKMQHIVGKRDESGAAAAHKKRADKLSALKVAMTDTVPAKEKQAAFKAGKIPEGWAEKPAKLRQKDRDARWTVKFSKARRRWDGAPQVDLAVPAFGCKNHVAIDRRHGLIRGWTASHAAAHDGARLGEVVDADNTAGDVWADTAYRSAKNEAWLAERGLVSRIHRKKPPGRPMAARTRRANASTCPTQFGPAVVSRARCAAAQR
jgi:hypothetical protein